MKRYACTLAVAPLLAAGAALAHPPDVMTEAQVRALLHSEGFARVIDVDYDADGFWEAEVLSAEGTELDVHVDPVTGRIVMEDAPPPRVVRVPPPVSTAAIPPLVAADVRAILVDAGFRDIHDIEYEDGVWHAEAYAPGGDDVEVEIDPLDGRIVHLEDD